LVLTCKKRTEFKLEEFALHFREVTKDLKETEKAYSLYFWMTENIEYDDEGYYSGIDRKYIDWQVYKYGKGLCSGYSNLFIYIGKIIGLYVLYIRGYSKGIDDNPKDITNNLHALNVIKLENVFYLIDSKWGAGNSNNNNKNNKKFEKQYNKFYFCTEPQYFIDSHYPVEKKWQLINPPFSFQKFIKRVIFTCQFHMFFKTDCIYDNIQVKKK
jgi:transglutaminase/protease-like cytokinesis protein 3